jgi:hypothetical protein
MLDYYERRPKLLNTGGVSVQEELLPLKSGVPAGVAMLLYHNMWKVSGGKMELSTLADLRDYATAGVLAEGCQASACWTSAVLISAALFRRHSSD